MNQRPYPIVTTWTKDHTLLLPHEPKIIPYCCHMNQRSYPIVTTWTKDQTLLLPHEPKTEPKIRPYCYHLNQRKNPRSDPIVTHMNQRQNQRSDHIVTTWTKDRTKDQTISLPHEPKTEPKVRPYCYHMNQTEPKIRPYRCRLKQGPVANIWTKDNDWWSRCWWFTKPVRAATACSLCLRGKKEVGIVSNSLCRKAAALSAASVQWKLGAPNKVCKTIILLLIARYLNHK